MRRTTIRPMLIELAPKELEDGVLYVSQKYKTAIHKCCCGCGEKVVTPLSPAHWRVRINGNSVTIHPSVGNWGMTCKSHYWIKNNRVVWAGLFSEAKIAAVRRRDSIDQKNQINTINRGNKATSEKGNLIDRIWHLIKGN